MKDLENVKVINADSVEILPFFDEHLGSKETDEKMIDQKIQYIKDHPNCYTFLGGDLIECNIYGSVGGTHGQKYQVNEQVEMMVNKLKPIKDKILFGICGNHEYRMEKSTSLDVSALICLNLDVPYFKWECHYMLKLNSIKAKSSNEKKNIYIYAHHGTGGGGTTGGKINSIEKLHFRAPLAHVLFCGHHHINLSSRKLIKYLSQKGNLKNFIQYYVVCGSAHGDSNESYGAQKAYSPLPVGYTLTKIKLTSNDEVRCDIQVFE